MKYAIVDSITNVVIYTTKDMSVVFHMKRQTTILDLTYQVVDNNIKDLESICYDTNHTNFISNTKSITLNEIVSQYGNEYFKKIKLLNYIAKTIEDITFYCKTVINEYECFLIDSQLVEQIYQDLTEHEEEKQLINSIIDHQKIKKINLVVLHIKYVNALLNAKSYDQIEKIKSEFKFELFEANHV